MSTYSNQLPPALQSLLQRVVWFLHPRSSCTTHISADVQRITLNASSCITISGRRTEQLNIIAGFLLHHWLYEYFLSFIFVERIRFFHGALQMFSVYCFSIIIVLTSSSSSSVTAHKQTFASQCCQQQSCDVSGSQWQPRAVQSACRQ